MAMDMRVAVRKLQIIYNECAPEAQKRKEEEANLDDFARLRKNIHREVKAIRKLLKERDELEAKNKTGANAKEIAELSYKIRQQIKQVKDDVNKINEIYKNDEKKLGKLRNTQSEKTKEFAAQVAHRKDISELCAKHLEECEELEKKRFSDRMGAGDRAALLAGGGQGGARPSRSGFGADDIRRAPASLETKELFAGGTRKYGAADGEGATGGASGAGGGTGGELPDIDVDDDLKMIQSKNQAIDKELEVIATGVGNLKEIALSMGRELEIQNDMLDKTTTKVDKVQEKLETLNTKMKKSVTGVMKGDKFLVNCVLLVVLLALGSYIATQFVTV